MQEVAFASEQLQVVTLPEAGARLHRLRAFGRDLLRTPHDPARHREDPFFWGAYVMAPWCNRLQAGPMRFGKRLLDLAPNFPDGTAIHGQVYRRPWEVRQDGSMTIRTGGDGWPWRYEVIEHVTVEGARLGLELALMNLDDERMPAGIGIHPWFVRPETVAVHADQVFPDNLQTDVDPEAVGGRLDLRKPAPMPVGLDATWTALSDPAVELTWPGVAATMRVLAGTPFVVAASPPDLDAAALELQTHAPHGLRRLVHQEPGAMAILRPGETLSLVLLLDFRELPPSG